MSMVLLTVLVWTLAVLGVIVFAISGIFNLLRRESSIGDWKKSLFFLILAIIFFFLIGIVAIEEDVADTRQFIPETEDVLQEELEEEFYDD